MDSGEGVMTNKFEKIVELKIRSFFFFVQIVKFERYPDPLIEFLSEIECTVNNALKP